MHMFQPGDKYKLRGHRAYITDVYVEIIAVDRLPESELQFKEIGVRDCFNAYAGEITYIVYSASTNAKKKKAELRRSRDSEEYANRYRKGICEYEWFSPMKRSYYPISSYEDKLN